MTFRNALCALAALWLGPAAGAQSLVLAGAFDGPLTGGTPKAVEIYVLQDIDDLGLYGFGSANNGGGTDGAEFIFPAGEAASAGDFLTLATEADGFTAYFGTAPTYVVGAASINGDDALELFFDADGDGDFSNAVVIDTFGDINASGTGQPWEYLDGWAYRQDGTGPDGSTFVLGNWFFSGVDANDDQTTNGSAPTPFPLGSYAPGAAAPLVQIVHNAPDPAAAVVDVYVDGALALDDFAFQTATPFLSLPTDVEVAVAPGASTSAADAVFTGTYQLAEGESYQLVAQGVLDPSMFAANPDGLSTAFTLAVNAFVGDAPGTPDDASDVEVTFFHGTPDAPAVDVRTGNVAQAVIFNDVPYGDFVFDYQPLPAAATELEVTSADATVSFGTATADLSGLAGQFVTAMASGFADPAANQGGAPLSLLLVLADGTTLTAVVSTAGEGEGEGAVFALFAPAPNPSTASTRVAFSLAAPGAATVAVYDALGRRVAVLADETLAADRHERRLDTARLAAGVYVVRLSTEAGVQQQTLTVVR